MRHVSKKFCFGVPVNHKILVLLMIGHSAKFISSSYNA